MGTQGEGGNVPYLPDGILYYDTLVDRSACKVVCVFVSSPVHRYVRILDALRAQL